MKSTAGYLLEALQAWGITHVFGVPGVHNLELYRGLAETRLRHITGRHEAGLGFMADGFARAADRPAACLTITGPGLTNILTAMGQAYGDSVPMVVIASQNKRAEIGTGRGFLHELPDQFAMASQLSVFAHRVLGPGELPEVLAHAFGCFRTARPRPVYLEIPRDVLSMRTGALPVVSARPFAATLPPADALTQAARALRQARAPLILAGGGAQRAAAEVRRLAEHLQAPVVMTSNARGVLTPEHALAVPFSPSLEPVRALVAAADKVLAIGTEIGPTDYDMYMSGEFPAPTHLIRIDIDSAQMNRGATPSIRLLGDSSATLRALLELDLGPMRAPTASERVSAACVAARNALSAPMRRQIEWLELIRETLPDALLVGDSTQPVYAGNLGFNAAAPGSWFNSATGFGTLGYGLPAATGASLGAPDRPVVCLVGDGGLQFSLGELGVLRDIGPWVAVVVWNNRGYEEIAASMRQMGIAPLGVAVRPPELPWLARAYGLPYERVDSTATLLHALQEFAQIRRAVIIDVDARAFS